MLPPLWYIDYETVVIILQVIKNLDRDLKEKIIQIIIQHEINEEYNLCAIDYNFNEYVPNDMDTSDYYWSE